METIVQAKRVLEIFKEMSQIPRESGNEKSISDYIVNFAKNLGLEVHQDEIFNVVIKKAMIAEGAVIEDNAIIKDEDDEISVVSEFELVKA